MTPMHNSHPNVKAGRPNSRELQAFTLLELLVVIGIIGALTFIAVPAFRGFGQANTLAAAQRQIQDDIGYARLQAIRQRSPVYMVFLSPTNGEDVTYFAGRMSAAVNMLASQGGSGNSSVVKSALRVLTNAYSSFGGVYALYTEQTVGDQPGVVNPRYLVFGEGRVWHSLPDGITFSKAMSVRLSTNGQTVANLPSRSVPFPLADIPAGVASERQTTVIMPRLPLPVLVFDSQGRIPLLNTSGGIDHYNPTRDDRFIALSLSSVFVPRISNGSARTKSPGPIDFSLPPDIVETPKENYTNSVFRIAGLTGRVRKESWPVYP